MRKLVCHASLPAAGFVDPWSVRAGGRAALRLSSSDAHPRVSVVRLDVEPIAPTGWTPVVLLPCVDVGVFEQGSWLEIPGAEDTDWFRALDVEFYVTRNAGPKTLAAGGGFRLDIGGRVTLTCGDAMAASDHVLEQQCWYVLRIDAADAALDVTIRPFGLDDVAIHLRLPSVQTKPGISVALGAALGAGDPTLNGRIGRVVLESHQGRVEWRFSPRESRTHVAPVVGAWPPLRVHNNPTFAVSSARADGGMDAVHLHDDDLGDCDWDASHALDVPLNAPSGIYAFEVATRDGTERIPFFVRPIRPARLVFLAPTATYVAYADEFLPAETYPWRCSDRGHRFAQDNDLRSLYDVHGDGSGVTLSTWRRPKVTLRDDYRYPLSDSPHLLPVDLQLLKFLRLHQIDIDVLTDHDLHAEGAHALRGYAGILTGSHPEYWSGPMMKALDDYLDGGGNLAYLGGNGFYLSVAIDGDRMELRRDPADPIWGSAESERVMTDGEPGGYWESRGRAPQGLVGSTFLMMGFGESRPYRRLPDSYADEWAWLFDGVGENPIGDTGHVLGGAAGYEVDGVIEQRKTPPALARLATADDFDASFQVREPLARTLGAAECARLRRADMTIYRHAGGGLVFSVGSVAWCGALPAAGSDNPVGAITLNIATHFVGREPARGREPEAGRKPEPGVWS
jgi:N,N-dimethylformamidase